MLKLRSLFKTAEAASPSIIFIDEIDSVEEAIEALMSNSAAALNQILSCMDGF